MGGISQRSSPVEWVGTAAVYEGEVRVPLYYDARGIMFREVSIRTNSEQQTEYLVELYRKRSTLCHQNIIKLAYAMPINDLCYEGVKIYMEYLPITLQESSVNKIPFGEMELVRLMGDIAQGVYSLEERRMLWNWLQPYDIRWRQNKWIIIDCQYQRFGRVGQLGPNLKYLLTRINITHSQLSSKMTELMHKLQYLTYWQISQLMRNWRKGVEIPKLMSSTPAAQYGEIRRNPR